MTFNAAALRLMADKGLSIGDVVEIAAAMELRSKGAERQARYRRRNRNESDVTGDVTPPLKEDTSNSSSSETKVSSEIDSSARAAKAFPRPDWANSDHWRDFMANRKRKRMTNSPTAYKQFLGDVDRLTDDEWPPGRLLELAAGKGWGSINKPEDQANGRQANRGNGGRMGGPRPDPTLALVRAARAAQREDAGDRGEARLALPPGEYG